MVTPAIWIMSVRRLDIMATVETMVVIFAAVHRVINTRVIAIKAGLETVAVMVVAIQTTRAFIATENG